jgi:hypothetical protein
MADFPIKDIPIGKPRRCPNCETQAVEIERLRDALKIAREAAIEECARVAEEHGTNPLCWIIAKQIRALKETT